MTNTITLSEQEVQKAIAYWLQHAYNITTNPSSVSVKFQELHGKNVYKGVEVVTIIAPSVQVDTVDVDLKGQPYGLQRT